MDDRIEGGFVVLARQIIGSSLMKMRAEDFKLAVYFIAKVNWQDSNWHDQWQHKEIIIKRGETIGSITVWSTEAKMSRRKTRTATKHLFENGFLLNLTPECVKRANGYTHIFVPNYEFYQDITNYLVPKRQTADNQPTNACQTGDHNRINKEDETSKQKKEELSSALPSDPPSHSTEVQGKEVIYFKVNNRRFPLIDPDSLQPFSSIEEAETRLGCSLSLPCAPFLLSISETHIKAWSEKFTYIDVGKEIDKMGEWLDGEPMKAQRYRSWTRFAENWLKRSNLEAKCGQAERQEARRKE
jgi:hypothetical protein